MTSPSFTQLVAEGATAIVLPYPPTLNHLQAIVGGRKISSARYREWQYDAGVCLAKQRPEPVAGKVAVTVELCAPDKRRRDLDNAGFKAVIDLLVKHRVIEADDSTIVREITARWVDSDNECTVFVRAA